jgi:hypothetical protein
MPRRTRPSIKILGLSPILKSYLTAGHSHRLTSGGTAVAAILLKLNQYRARPPFADFRPYVILSGFSSHKFCAFYQVCQRSLNNQYVPA